jgi:hypothetical protein
VRWESAHPLTTAPPPYHVVSAAAATSPLSPWPATPDADVAAIVLELADEERSVVPAA